MTACVIDGKPCQCQPDEGMACPHGTPAEVQAALNAEVIRLRALSAQPAAVPGWQWVPVEQTPEMKDACLKATKGWWDSRAWPAMLAAAPQAPQQDEAAPNVAGNRLAGGKSELTGLLGVPARSEKE